MTTPSDAGARPRLKRAEPERTQPDRSPMGVLRDPGPAQAKDSGARKRGGGEGKPMATAEDAVIYGVRLGYRVAEEQILRGQRLARRLRSASEKSGSGDVGEMIDGTLRLWKQLGILWVEIAETLLRSPNLGRALLQRLRADGKKGPSDSGRRGESSGTVARLLELLLGGDTGSQAVRDALGELAKSLPPEALALLREVLFGAQAAPDGRDPSGDAPRGSAVTYPIAVSSDRLARVSLSVWREPAGDELPQVYPLYARSGEALTDVRFERVPGGPATLRVVIPKGKQAGEYRGTLVDSKGAYVGQVSVAIEGDAS